MANGTLWNLAPVLVGAPLTAIACAVVVTLVRAWPLIMERVNEARRDRATIRTGEMERMDARIRRLEDRCTELEDEKDECRRQLEGVRDELAAERAARMKLQAIIDGRGEVNQAAAVAAAEVRLDAEAKAKGRKR